MEKAERVLQSLEKPYNQASYYPEPGEAREQILREMDVVIVGQPMGY